MLDKIKNYQNHPLYHELRDVRSLGLIAFAVVVLLVSWSGAQAIQSNYKLEQQMEALQRQNELRALENQNQKLKNAYYNTPQYLELAARQNFGLARPGEKELIVPKEVAMKYVAGQQLVTAESTVAVDKAKVAEKQLPFYQRNLQAWSNFFLNRRSTD